MRACTGTIPFCFETDPPGPRGDLIRNKTVQCAKFSSRLANTEPLWP